MSSLREGNNNNRKKSCVCRSRASEWRFARKRIGPWSSALLSGLANCLFMWFIITACLSCTAEQGNSSPLLIPSAVVSCLPEKGDDTFAVRNCKWRCTYYRTTATVHTCVVCSCMWPEVSFHVPLVQIACWFMQGLI